MRKYRRIFLILGLVIPILTVVLLTTGCSSGFAYQQKENSTTNLPSSDGIRPTNGLVQSSTEDAVTIEVKWLGEDKGSLLLEVVMDSHSVNLDSYDLSQLAVLRDNQSKEYRPDSWDSPLGGHHRRGTLTFSSSVDGETKYIELIIRDVGEISERIFRWELR